MTKTNRAQREALAKLYSRDHDPTYDRASWLQGYRLFRKTVVPYFGDDCILVPWCGMWVGIEKDGYTHKRTV